MSESRTLSSYSQVLTSKRSLLFDRPNPLSRLNKPSQFGSTLSYTEEGQRVKNSSLTARAYHARNSARDRWSGRLLILTDLLHLKALTLETKPKRPKPVKT